MNCRLLLLSTIFVSSASSFACNSTKIELFKNYKMISERCQSGSRGPDEDEVGDAIPGQWLLQWRDRNPGATVSACDGVVEARIPNRNYCGDGDLIYIYQLVTDDHSG